MNDRVGAVGPTKTTRREDDGLRCEWPGCRRPEWDDGLCEQHKREADDLDLGGFDGTT